ncbi:MAG: HPr family phosphocarrier protein [Firmicutes bacterium]|nr:HPr family phosphocarrier protein [Candidatus Fermentithermobacillaceae bacterium]
MVRATVKVKNKVGLHARPAALFVQEAMKYPCKIIVESDGKRADAKSILQVLALGVKCGQEISIITEGENEHTALQKLVSLVENGLEGA